MKNETTTLSTRLTGPEHTAMCEACDAMGWSLSQLLRYGALHLATHIRNDPPPAYACGVADTTICRVVPRIPPPTDS